MRPGRDDSGAGAPDAREPAGASWHASCVAALELFTVTQARATLARLLPLLDEVVRLRADAAELAAAAAAGRVIELGGLPELKALHARMDELLTEVTRSGVQLKGVAPLLLDFPSEVQPRGGAAVLAGG